MPLHHITLAQHQYTTNGQFSVFRDPYLITELVIRQVLVGKRWILVTNLVPKCFQRTLVEVIETCSLYHLLTLAAKSLITHHRHHLRLSSTPVSAASPNESIDRITEVYGLHDGRRHEECQHQLPVKVVFLSLSRQPHIELLPIAQSVQEVRFRLLPVVHALYLKQFSSLLNAEYYPSARGIGECRYRFPHILRQFVLGRFTLKIVPFYLRQFL